MQPRGVCSKGSWALSWEKSIPAGPPATGHSIHALCEHLPESPHSMPGSLFTYSPGVPNPQGDIRQSHREFFQFRLKLP